MLERFIDAQKYSYSTALEEIRQGRKQSHWMWYIFPQIAGLGKSSMAQYYGIINLQEAVQYINHPILGSRLIEISNALLALECDNATQIFGHPDDMKLKSCMTLFAIAAPEKPEFQAVLDKYYGGKRDNKTRYLLKIGNK